MTTTINGSSPSVTFSDGTTQSTAGLPLTGGSVTGSVNISGNVGIGLTNSSYGKLAVYGTFVVGNSTGALPSASLGGIGWYSGGNGIGTLVMGSSLSFCDQIDFITSSGAAGTISSNGNTTNYGTSSDYRLKENIIPLVGALEVISQLNPVSYTWKTDGSKGYGFIAHEIQQIIPECVYGVKDAVKEDGTPKYQQLDQSKIVATLTAAIKEQQALITTLQAQVTALNTKVGI